MNKYHLNKKGVVAKCVAYVSKCPLSKGEDNHVTAPSMEAAEKEFEKLEEGKSENELFPTIDKEVIEETKNNWISEDDWKSISSLSHDSSPAEFERLGKLVVDEANSRIKSRHGFHPNYKPRNEFELEHLFKIAEVNREVFSDLFETTDMFHPEKLNPKGDYENSFSSVSVIPDVIKNKDVNTVFNVSEAEDDSQTRGQYEAKRINGKRHYSIKIPKFKEEDSLEDEYEKDSQVLHEYIHHLCDKDRSTFRKRRKDIEKYPQKILYNRFNNESLVESRMKTNPEEFTAYSVQEWYYPGSSQFPNSVQTKFYGAPPYRNETKMMNFSIGWLMQQAKIPQLPKMSSNINSE